MEVRYIYSACVVIDTSDIKICCDPWFTPGAYDGSWYQYPPLLRDPIDIIGEVDWIYISHIHPDHYDPEFLRCYLQRYPHTQIIIGETSPPHLERKIKMDGFTPKIIKQEVVGQSQIHIIPNHAYEHDNIDTALVVVRDDLSIVNLNDNPFDEGQIKAILDICPNSQVTFALLPYCGAGPYPQTYDFDTTEDLKLAANRKQEQFLQGYHRYVEQLNPVRAMPFAGKYLLGGPLSSLNENRGVPDPILVTNRYPEVSIVLEDGGDAVFDLHSLTATAIRTEAYQADQIDQHIRSLVFDGYAYEREIQPLRNRSLPLIPLINSAYFKNIGQSLVEKEFWLCFKSIASTNFIVLNIERNSSSGVKITNDVSEFYPRCEITIDDRYLFGLLTRL